MSMKQAMLKLIDLGILLLILFNTYSTDASKECEAQMLPNPRSYGILGQYFYSQKTESLQQCMVMCSQFPLCKSLGYVKGKCRLKKMIKEDAYLFGCYCREIYYPASSIPKQISGPCADHGCRNNTNCMPLQSGTYKCVPHNIPTFSCPSQWAYSSTKCYKFHLKLLTWQAAQEYCLSLNSNLTEIGSSEDQHFLSSMLKYVDHVPRGLKSFDGKEIIFWTSLAHQHNGNWAWNASGRFIDDSSFTSWSPNYTKMIKANRTNCVGLSNVTFYKWTVVDCLMPNFVICEKMMVL